MHHQLPPKTKRLGLLAPESSVSNVIEIPRTIIFRFSKTSNATTAKIMTCADVKSQDNRYQAKQNVENYNFGKYCEFVIKEDFAAFEGSISNRIFPVHVNIVIYALH